MVWKIEQRTVCSFLMSSSKLTVPGRAAVTRSCLEEEGGLVMYKMEDWAWDGAYAIEQSELLSVSIIIWIWNG